MHFLNVAGVADVLQVLPRGVSFGNFLLQSNCADALGCQTEKWINQTAHNLLWEFLQVSETTTVGAQKKCYNVRATLSLRGRGGKLKRKGHLQFWCLTTFCSNGHRANLPCPRRADDSLFIPCACRQVYSCLLKSLVLQTLLHLLDFKCASNPIGVNCQQLILGAMTLPTSQD